MTHVTSGHVGLLEQRPTSLDCKFLNEAVTTSLTRVADTSTMASIFPSLGSLPLLSRELQDQIYHDVFSKRCVAGHTAHNAVSGREQAPFIWQQLHNGIQRVPAKNVGLFDASKALRREALDAFCSGYVHKLGAPWKFVPPFRPSLSAPRGSLRAPRTGSEPNGFHRTTHRYEILHQERLHTPLGGRPVDDFYTDILRNLAGAETKRKTCLVAFQKFSRLPCL
ncbi:MAG: hypothetical protein ALECFALPRED_008871 [Alectoria fallacina]|uniref:Uncharacterized protein n=1 Tax=Alectoria fallacina TaxID=1903189 RepID=A0A8H3J4Y0_9LECA|nr:MAG: hypothetical protein ALECFALPRED_008871 [Alectoria fallacina]